MDPVIPGIHHVTAIAGSPQQNLDFYVGLLGLRLVKRTVNFDDPGTYHFYLGDEAGTPGTILTFFPWPNAVRGTTGAGMAQDTAFSVPVGSLSFWADRFHAAEWPFQGPLRRFGDGCLMFEDPHGLSLQLVEDASAVSRPGRTTSEISAEHAIRGFHSVTLAVSNRTATARVLTELFGYVSEGEEADVLRFRATSGDVGAILDVIAVAGAGRLGAGTVHHVAFRARDGAEQRFWQERVIAAGLHPTDIRDRNYFRSIYFREPGGVLFEIATDSPGFAVDESHEELVTSLKLPSWLEVHRNRIEQQLPPIQVPS